MDVVRAVPPPKADLMAFSSVNVTASRRRAGRHADDRVGTATVAVPPTPTRSL